MTAPLLYRPILTPMILTPLLAPFDGYAVLTRDGGAIPVEPEPEPQADREAA